MFIVEKKTITNIFVLSVVPKTSLLIIELLFITLRSSLNKLKLLKNNQVIKLKLFKG